MSLSTTTEKPLRRNTSTVRYCYACKAHLNVNAAKQNCPKDTCHLRRLARQYFRLPSDTWSPINENRSHDEYYVHPSALPPTKLDGTFEQEVIHHWFDDGVSDRTDPHQWLHMVVQPANQVVLLHYPVSTLTRVDKQTIYIIRRSDYQVIAEGKLSPDCKTMTWNLNVQNNQSQTF